MTNPIARLNFAAIAVVTILACVMTALAWPGSASAAPVVLACAGDWGSSNSCGGCSALTWQTPAPTLKVKTDASQFWAVLSTLKPTDNVAISSQAPGSPATCAQVTGMASVASLTTTQPAPPTPVPSSNPGSLTVTWSPTLFNTDGSAATIANYRLTCSGPTPINQLTGNVLTFTASNLSAGIYSCMMSAIDTAGDESAQSNAAVVTVTASTPIPAPIPTPIPPPTITEVFGTWTLKKATTNIQTGIVDYPACKALAASKATTTATKYTCNVSNTVTVKQ